MGQQKATRAIGVLGQSGPVGAMPGQGRLLVPRHGEDGQCDAEPVGPRLPEPLGGPANLGQQVRGDAEQLAQPGVPSSRFQVHQRGPRGVGAVGGVQSAGQPPDQPGIHRARREFAVFRSCPSPFDVVEDPRDLGCREVGIEFQAGHPAHALGGRGKLLASVGGSSVLPNDGGMDGSSGGALPDNHGLALVGDGDAEEVVRGDSGLGEGASRRSELGVPNGLGVVLHPSRTRVRLREFDLAHTKRTASGIEHDGPR